MVGSRPVGSGLGSTRLNTPQGLQQEIVLPVPRVDGGLQPDSAQTRNVGMGGVGSVQSEPVLPSLNTPRVLQPEGAAVRRALGLELEGSIEEVVSRLSAGGSRMDNQKDQWAKLMGQRQNLLEEKVNTVISGLGKLSTAVHGAEAMYLELQDKIGILENSYTKLWEKLELEDQRFDRLETSVQGLDIKLDEKVEMIQDWFVHISTQVHTEVPTELVNSIQEVIADSSPGLAVNRMREELEEIRDSLDSSKHVTEGLRGLVVDLSDQIVNNSMQSVLNESRMQEGESRTFESHARERELVKRSIERARKQLQQIVLADLGMNPVDISLVKKYKTVDVPAVHSAVGNIQKSLQKYVKFPGVSYDYCDEVNEFLDYAENWCLKVEEMYNTAEVHSINTSKGDTADVGIFSDNATMTIYEFLEAAEIAYLGWGNSTQKANRMYNKHLSEEIKNKLINMSDSYPDMKRWLIANYGGV